MRLTIWDMEGEVYIDEKDHGEGTWVPGELARVLLNTHDLAGQAIARRRIALDVWNYFKRWMDHDSYVYDQDEIDEFKANCRELGLHWECVLVPPAPLER